MKQMVSEILTDSRDLHGLFEESAFQKEQKKWQFTVWYTQYAARRHLGIVKDRNALPVRREKTDEKNQWRSRVLFIGLYFVQF